MTFAMQTGSAGLVGGASDESLLEGFRSLRAAVVGEAMLDVYLRGRVNRLSPEGPFPVVDSPARDTALGGAANVAANAAGMGATVDLISVVGNDASGAELAALAAEHRVDVASLVRDPLRLTLSKTRVVGEGRTLVRVDEGSIEPPPPAVRHELRGNLARAAAGADVVIVSDYRYGVMSEEILAWLREAQPRPLLVVDSKELGRYRALRPDVVTSNYGEVAELLGVREAFGGDRVDHIRRNAPEILSRTGAGLAAVTLDADGVMLVRAGRPPRHLPALGGPAEPCGAGDTFTAAMSLALASGAAPADATALGQRAAAVVLNKPGTAVCLVEELRGADSEKLCDPDTVVEVTQRHRAAGRTIVFTNGCFDILHAGHVASLGEAARLGDVLVVGLNSDASVARLKGPGRPVNSLGDRAAVLAGLSMVDYIVVFDGDSPVPLLSRVRPDVYCKGGDYRGRWIPEMDLVRTWNGRTHYTSHVPDHSTTRTVERVRSEGAAGLKAVR